MYRFLLFVALTWVVAIFVDSYVDKPAPRAVFVVSPVLTPSTPYIQPHHFEER